MSITTTMKLLVITLSLLILTTSAFGFTSVKAPSSFKADTSLHLFGGKKEGGGPSAMDKVAMFQKAQQVASKREK